jgi:hypothetical protein
MSLSQRIVQLEDQRSSLANMDGSVDIRIAELKLKARDSQAQLMRTLIEQRNPQDFSGAPLPSGHSVDSRAMGSTQDSRYSAASGQHPPSSLASASRATVNPRREDRRMAAAPYSPSKSSGSGATTIDNGSCRHKPRVKINPDTFVACSDTDDELAVLDQKAIRRVKTRKSRSKRAAELGLTSTAELCRLDQDAHAANNGHSSRQAAYMAGKDKRAAKNGHTSRQAADLAEKDQRAAKNGHTSRQAADMAGKDQRAAKNGHTSRQAADLAGKDQRAAKNGHTSRQAAHEVTRDRLAVLQLGEGASRGDLARIQKGESALAKEIGVDVREIRSVRMPVNTAPPPLSPQLSSSSVRPIVNVLSMEDAWSRRWNVGDRFTVLWQRGGRSRHFEVTRNRNDWEDRFEADFKELL